MARQAKKIRSLEQFQETYFPKDKKPATHGGRDFGVQLARESLRKLSRVITSS
jgi:hypothetical protein